MSSANKSKTTNFKDFVPSNITVTEIQETKENQAQFTAFLNYSGSRFELQTPWIELESGGVPRIDDFHPTEKSRCCIKVPLKASASDDIKQFYTKMIELDKILGNDESRTKMFNKKAGKYKFLPCVYHPPSDDDDAPSTKAPSLKCRFAAKLEKDAVKEIKTEVYISTVANGKVVKREQQTVNTMDELANIVRFRSKIRLIINPTRVWASKTLQPGADKMTYGVIWQVKGIEVEPSIYNNAGANTNADFIDDSESEEEGKPAAKTNLISQLTKKKTHDSDDEEEPVTKSKIDSDEEDEEEEAEIEPVPEPPKKSKSKAPADKKKK